MNVAVGACVGSCVGDVDGTAETVGAGDPVGAADGLFCAFFSSRARFDDESCSDKFGSKLSTVISLFNKSDGAMHKISDWKAPALFCAC